MSDIQSLTATPHKILFNGKLYQCSHLTQEKKAEFASWLKRQANVALADYRRDTGDVDGWREMARELKEEAEAGKYCFHSDKSLKALQNPAGVLALSAILFGVSEEEMVKLTMNHSAEVQAILELVLAESVSDPNG
jgi:hypothetical protein